MSYQALYRVWRPQTFDELVGQEMIATTLKNAISHQQLSHAYLFTGPRGTGKTSAAKILAKAVNCLHPSHGNPCNECEICQLINDNQLSDVIEIDAASNNGVEEIRDLRDKVRYAPTQAKYKVYIIDEVHMLTTGAFNALLKTLEEPPEHVLFILATTEPHKIPATIISRTQRFDFQRIQDRDLIKRMEEILTHEAKEYEPEALAIIARSANGGMRDSLSLLDQALSFSPEQLTAETARQVSGSLDQQVYVDYTLELYAHQAEEALQLMHKQLQLGKQATRFIEEMILFCRDVLLTQATETNYTLLERSELETLLAEVPTDFYYYLIDQLNTAQEQMRYSTQLDLYLEVMTVQVAQRASVEETAEVSPSSPANASSTVELAQLQAQVQQLQTQVQTQADELQQLQLNATKAAAQIPQAARSSEEPPTPRPRPANMQSNYYAFKQLVYLTLNDATHEDRRKYKGSWNELIYRLSPTQRAPLEHAELLAIGPTYGLLGFDSEMYAHLFQTDRTYSQALDQMTTEMFEETRQWLAITQGDWATRRQEYVQLRKEQDTDKVELNQEQLTKERNHLGDVDHHQEAQTEAVKESSSQLEDLTEDEANAVQPTVPPQEETSQPEVSAEVEKTREVEDNSTELEAPPAIVQKAIDIFGADNINVYHDR